MKSVYMSSLLLAAAVGLLAPRADAASGPSVKAQSFRLLGFTTTSEGPFVVDFKSTTSTVFDAGCGDWGWVKLETSYMSSKNLQYAKELILASQLSNRPLNIATSGCIGGYAKLTHIGFAP